jgi:iron complex transport system substrate-binding protein
MKTKNRIVALIEIAIVLCSVFLVSALPAIAAEQTMQKASASEVTTASEDDFVLGIYGNANEDDTIDMRDLTYEKLIFFGKKPETELADAKYDGKINPLDFIQIKLIIVGKEKELTIVDSVDRTVTIYKPVERIVGLGQTAEAIKILKAEDKMVGVTNRIVGWAVLFPELSKLPSVGTRFIPDYEKIIELEPDIVIWTAYAQAPELEEKLEPAGIPVVRLYFCDPATIIEEIRKLEYILDRKEANEFIDWYNGYIDDIKHRTDTLSEDDKPRVYFEMLVSVYQTFTRDYGPDTQITIAGGRNIAADLGNPGNVIVDKEWVVEQNPEVIIKAVARPAHGYEVDDTSEMRAARDAILNRPELVGVTAITTERVHLLPWTSIAVTPRSVIGTAYLAKWFHPDLFTDLDPKAIHQEYLDRFMRIDYNLDEQGVFVYPPLED